MYSYCTDSGSASDMFWDAGFFLFATTAFGFLVFACQHDLSQKEKEICFALQNFANVGFFVVWGGYSVDALNYLYGFLGSPSVYNKEQLFYIVGFGLDKLFDQPWPLKIMSATCALLIGGACLMFYGRKNIPAAIVALSLLHLAPAFFILVGNALRQGFSAALLVLSIAALSRRKFWLSAAFLGLGYFFHTSILVVGLVIPLLMLPPRWIAILLALSLFPSAIMLMALDLDQISDLLGKNIEYLTRREGTYHYEKFVLSYGLAWLFVAVITRRLANDIMVRAYTLIVALSTSLVMFEIPYERFLGYSEIVLPLAGATILSSQWDNVSVTLKAIGTICILGLGLLLWNHPSITKTLLFSFYRFNS